MSEQIIRLTGQDSGLLPKLASARLSARGATPSRVVIDATTAAKTTAIRDAARQLGLPYLVDPLTFYLADSQHPGDAWARLPFADPSIVTATDLISPRAADRLVAATLEFQLDQGVTQLIAPYVHVERADDGWVEAQAGLYRRTRAYLTANDVAVPVLAPLAMSWRLLSRVRWPEALDPLSAALRELAPDDVALAASRVHQGARAEDRLADLLASTSELARRHSVIAWRQGLFGEASVAAGAAGYETGIGWGERCDVRQLMAGRRKPAGGGPGPRPVYVTDLGASLPKRTVAALMAAPAMAARLTCLDPNCCPTGKQALLGDARAHAVRARAARLSAVAAAGHPRWAWKLIGDRARKSLDLAAAVNILANRGDVPFRTDVTGLSALAVISDARRQNATRSRVA
jgi:hypothetical protein